jgi:hypothetical protein
MSARQSTSAAPRVRSSRRTPSAAQVMLMVRDQRAPCTQT